MASIEESEEEKNLISLLSKRNFEGVLTMLKDPKHDSFFLGNMSNLMKLICHNVKTEILLENEDGIHACKKMLIMLVDKGNSKDVLLAVLKQVNSFKDHHVFCSLLDPLKTILMKNPGEREKSLQLVLSTLNAHIATLDLPNNDIPDEEKVLSDTDSVVQNTAYVLNHHLSFIESFVDEVSFSNLKDKEVHYIQGTYQQQELLQRYILKLFYHPLLYHDFHILSDNRPKHVMQSLCENYIKCLSKICKNVFSLFKYASKKEENDKNENYVPVLAFSNLSYLIFVENMAADFQPFVYSNVFIFIKNIFYIVAFLESSNDFVLSKGLSLADTLLNRLDDSELDDVDELDAIAQFPMVLLNICMEREQAIRNSVIKIFKLYVSKCSSRNRYNLIMRALHKVDHSGAEGLLISLFNDYLLKAVSGDDSNTYFLGRNFRLFVKKVYNLTNLEIDVLIVRDKIVAALNLLKCVLIEDPREKNISGVWDVINYIIEKFISPLATKLDQSRAMYKQALKDVTASSTNERGANFVQAMFPDLSMDKERKMYSNALKTFDMIESLLCDVRKIIS